MAMNGVGLKMAKKTKATWKGFLKELNMERTALHLNTSIDTMATQDAMRLLIAQSVDSTIRQHFPKNYHSICHAYAVIGSNVASIVLGREYRPVAGLAVIDCGDGCFMNFTDDSAFYNEGDGAYHCWIESCHHDGCGKELIDISFLHKEAFAKSQNIVWRKMPAFYLWGSTADLVIDAELNNLPSIFPEGKIWLRETQNGIEWMSRRVEDLMEHYVIPFLTH
jgi:hypothetical protein